MKKYIVVTNNPLSACNVSAAHYLHFLEGEGLLDVLIDVRAKVHCGFRLATHPLTSSLKPNETPYKTVLLYPKQAALCQQSLALVESAIRTYESFARNSRPISWVTMPKNILDDLALIDYDMVREAIL